MASEINPSLTPTKSLSNFRFWCQKVLPLVYDDSLSYYEVLGKMVVQLNDVIDDVNADTENVLTLKDAFLELQTYVNEFFDDIDQLASYAERAETAQTAANQSAINASESAANASASSLTAMNARDAANSARQAAETSANTASTAADNANTKANEAAQSAITAQTAQASASQSATLAATDRSAAQTAASTATTKASEASTSASNAAQSAEDAEDAAQSVEDSAQQITTNASDIADLKTLKPESIYNGNLTFSGIHTIPVNMKQGRTLYISVDNITTEADFNQCLITFMNESAQVGITYASLNNYNRGFILNSDITSVILYSGYNYSTSAGKTATYTNLKITIENEIAQTIRKSNSCVAPVFESFYAGKLLNLNDLFIVGNKLYKAVTTISNGALINVGTNAVETTIAELLTPLL